MRKWQDAGYAFAPVLIPVLSPARNSIRQALLPILAEMIGLRVLADDKDQLDLRHQGKQAIMPGDTAFRSRWQVPALRVQTRKAKAHRDDGQPVRIIEDALPDPHPVPQAIA